MSRPVVRPGEVWWADLEPVRGREQGRDRPVLVVSSRFHLALTAGALITVLPLTTVEREGWLHRTSLAAGGRVVTEQIRTVSAERLRRPAPDIGLTSAELAEVRRVLAQMLI